VRGGGSAYEILERKCKSQNAKCKLKNVKWKSQNAKVKGQKSKVKGQKSKVKVRISKGLPPDGSSRPSCFRENGVGHSHFLKGEAEGLGEGH
jgi:hypothetical protein